MDYMTRRMTTKIMENNEQIYFPEGALSFAIEGKSALNDQNCGES